MSKNEEFPTALEKFVTLKAAAEASGVHYFKVRRAVQAGLIPSYTLLNGRRLVRLSEVAAAIEASRQGGDQ